VGQKPGAFEVAGRGTILLDEIGALPIHLQPLLLRVIESKLVKRVGDARDMPVYCRVLASTNEHVQRAIRENRLRSDLYYRFRWRIHVPPLRERAEDIPFLARYFLNYDCDRLGIPRKHFDADALAALLNYPWPGNIRQLESALDILAITVEKTVITAQELRELFSRYGDEPTVAVETSELFKTKRIPYYFGPPVSDPSRFFVINHLKSSFSELSPV
jgi:transcriptional regulator with PAS, ATPase and Fis domain